MAAPDSHVFFGYPSEPELLRETIASAAAQIGRVGGVTAQTWEELRVSGRVVVKRVLAGIDASDVAAFDITTLNENVLFEVGYSTGRDHRVWLLRDTTNADAGEMFRKVGILNGIGFTKYTSSDDIVGAFMQDRPDIDTDSTLLSDLLERADEQTAPSLLYIKSPHNTEAERALTRQVEIERKSGVRCIAADARESSVEPLSWYAAHCYEAHAVLVHLAAPHRAGASVHNARSSLIAGLAVGLGKPVLMVAEENYLAPLDYEDLLYVYASARDAEGRVRPWLGRVLEEAHHEVDARAEQAHARRRASELGRIRLGEPVAENEAQQLADYFIETALYGEVLEPRTAIFVGRKGTGKTATLMRAAEELEVDRRNVVSVIQPSSYDLDGLLRLLRRYEQPDAKSFLVEALWKYLLYSEIALSVQRDFLRRPAGLVPDSPEWRLNQYLEGPGSVFALDFATRLERTVDSLLTLPRSDKIEDERAGIARALHADILAELRTLLGDSLRTKNRVAVLIDNLDQAWSTADDHSDLAFLLLGLLTTATNITSDFARALKLANCTLTLAVFIRSDIFYRVSVSAREPDKLPVRKISWADPQQLLRVVESRYVASQGPDTPPKQLWQKHFHGSVGGVEAPDYVVSRVLPRPRDILYLCSAAIDIALRRGHSSVSESDLLEAERLYSQFAFEALQVEMGSLPGELEDIFYEFAGLPDIVDDHDVIDALAAGGVPEDRRAEVLRQLRLLSFLGTEVAHQEFRFAEDPAELRIADALAAQHQKRSRSGPRYRINPAFQAYLEVVDSTTSGQEAFSLDA